MARGPAFASWVAQAKMLIRGFAALPWWRFVMGLTLRYWIAVPSFAGEALLGSEAAAVLEGWMLGQGFSMTLPKGAKVLGLSASAVMV